MTKRKKILVKDLPPAESEAMRALIRETTERLIAAIDRRLANLDRKKIVLAGVKRVHEPTDEAPKNAA